MFHQNWSNTTWHTHTASVSHFFLFLFFWWPAFPPMSVVLSDVFPDVSAGGSTTPRSARGVEAWCIYPSIWQQHTLCCLEITLLWFPQAFIKKNHGITGGWKPVPSGWIKMNPKGLLVQKRILSSSIFTVDNYVCSLSSAETATLRYCCAAVRKGTANPTLEGWSC